MMKSLIIISIIILTVFTVNAQSSEKESNPAYDSVLAKKLGADKYGMKSYIFVILKTGNNKTTNKAFIDSCFRVHLANIGKLVKAGKLIVAGPFAKNENTYRGLFILNAVSIDEAKELLKTDMAIKENLLEAEMYKWYGSAALAEYMFADDKIWKEKP